MNNNNNGNPPRDPGQNALIRSFTQVKQKMQLKNSILSQSKRSMMASQRQSELGLAAQTPTSQADKLKKSIHNASFYAKKPVQEKPKNTNDQEEAFRSMDEHKIPLEELRQRLETDWNSGLSQAVAKERNERFGDNALTEKAKTPWWVKLAKEMLNWFAIMLWVGSGLCIMAFFLQPSQPSNLYLGIILIAVVIITGLITFQQSAQSEALMDSFQNMIPPQCTVIRGGEKTQIMAQKLVPGDVVQVAMGEKVPADIRVIFSREMKVDNSPLTGQADPLLRVVECTSPENPLETKNLCFFGTLIKEGSGKGVVIKIGDNTVLGQIADLAATGETPQTPLRIELDFFVLLITIIALVLGVSFFLLALFVVHYTILECIVFGIGILVANVPQGLLGCITVSLAITAKRLSLQQVLVKNLEAVETLGSTSCICSDKTGTLTQNKMTVENIWYDGLKRKAINKLKVGRNADLEYEVNDPGFRILHQVTILCSEAKFDVPKGVNTSGDYNWLEAPVIGDASETALVKFFQPIENIDVTRGKFQFVKLKDGSLAKMPFNSTNKYALSIIQYEKEDSHYCVLIKGAPEKIWKFCSHILVNGRYEPINESWQSKFQRVNLEFGKGGERVLGFAKMHLLKEFHPQGFNFNINSPEQFNFSLNEFAFVGLISLMDPPQETVPAAVLKCKAASIKVIMVTGDQPPTAAAIAKQCNIIPMQEKTVDDIAEQRNCSWEEALQYTDAIVVHGDRVNKAIEDEINNGVPQEQQDRVLCEWVKKPYCVFARTSPAQKLKIVRACQKVGHIVGVTGDGVNDSPAIKQGDIGISMGISGSDVTKDAADMILLNDDFASIVDGVQEGRQIFDNLKKTVVYLLTSNITQVFPFLGNVIFQFPLPLSSVFMLCICVGTDILPAISLAYEEAEPDIMTRKPRKKTDRLVSRKLITHAYLLQGWIATAAGFMGYFTVMYHYGFTMEGLFGMCEYPAYPRPPNNSPYNPLLFNLGNTMLGPASYVVGNDCRNYNMYLFEMTNEIDWVWINDANYDMRNILVRCNSEGFWEPQFNYQKWCQAAGSHNTSPISNWNICYTTEALKYAQSAYFIAIVLVQWSNIICCKSKKASFRHSTLNQVMFGGILLETCLCVLLTWCPGVNQVFGGRPLGILYFGTPGIPFSMLLLFWDQSRRALIRNWPSVERGQLNWFDRFSHW